MAKKNRFPQHFGWEDFLTFMRELLSWLVSQVGQPDHQPGLEVGLSDLVDDYETGLVTYAAKKNLAPELRELKDNAVKALREALIRVKMTLPVFFDDPSILGEFNLAQDIATDEDDLYIQASACLAHWDVVKALPEYAGMVADMTVVEDAFADFVDKRGTYSATFQALQAAQNDLIDLRAPIQDMERRIFDWYRSRYRSAQDEFWTETPWGTASQQGGGGTSWNDAPKGKLTKAELPLRGLLAGCEPYEGTTRFDFRIVGAKKNQPIPDMPLVDWRTNIEQPTLVPVDFPLEKGYVYYLWIRARKDNEVSEWSEVVGIEWTEG